MQEPTETGVYKIDFENETTKVSGFAFYAKSSAAWYEMSDTPRRAILAWVLGKPSFWLPRHSKNLKWSEVEDLDKALDELLYHSPQGDDLASNCRVPLLYQHYDYATDFQPGTIVVLPEGTREMVALPLTPLTPQVGNLASYTLEKAVLTLAADIPAVSSPQPPEGCGVYKINFIQGRSGVELFAYYDGSKWYMSATSINFALENYRKKDVSTILNSSSSHANWSWSTT